MLDKKWWERWQLYTGCSEGVDAGHVGEDASDGAAACTSAAAAAAEGSADSGPVAAGAAAETSGTVDAGKSAVTAVAATATTVTESEEGVKVGQDGPAAVPPCVSVEDSDGGGGGGDGAASNGGGLAQTSRKARQSDDPKAGAMPTVHMRVGISCFVLPDFYTEISPLLIEW